MIAVEKNEDDDNVQEAPDAAMAVEPQTPTTKRKQMDTTPPSYTLPKEPPKRVTGHVALYHEVRVDRDAFDTRVGDYGDSSDRCMKRRKKNDYDDDEQDQDDGEDAEYEDDPKFEPHPVQEWTIEDMDYYKQFDNFFGRSERKWLDSRQLNDSHSIDATLNSWKLHSKSYGVEKQDSKGWLDLSKVTPEWKLDRYNRFNTFDQMKACKVVVSYENDAGGRRAIVCTLLELYYLHRRPGRNRPPTFHAFLLPNKPCHLMLDLEMDGEKSSELMKRFDGYWGSTKAQRARERMETQVLHRLDQFWLKVFGRELCRDEVQVEDSSDWEHGIMSFHFHIVSEGFKTPADMGNCLEAWAQSLEHTYLGDDDLLIIRDGDKPSFIRTIDTQVYATGQRAKTLRMVGSVKMAKDYQNGKVRPMMPAVMRSNKTLGEHLMYSMPSHSIRLRNGQELLTWGETEKRNLDFPLAIPAAVPARAAATVAPAAADGQREYAPIPAETLREMAMTLGEHRLKDRQKRINVIYCLQNCGGDQELALDYYKRSGRPGPEEATNRHWKSGEKWTGNKFNAGSLRNWLKEDLGEEEYKSRCRTWFPREPTASRDKCPNMGREVLRKMVMSLNADRTKLDSLLPTVHMIRSAGGELELAQEFFRAKQPDAFDEEKVSQAWDLTAAPTKVNRRKLYAALDADKTEPDWQIKMWKSALALHWGVVESPRKEKADPLPPPTINLEEELEDFIPWEKYTDAYDLHAKDKESYKLWHAAVMNDLNRYCASIDCKSKAYILVRTVEHNEELGTTVPHYEARSLSNFHECYQQFSVLPLDTKVITGPVSLPQLYIKWKGRRVFKKETMRYATKPKHYFNTFTRLAVTKELAAERSKGQTCQPFLDFLKRCFCAGDDGLYNWLLNWLADKVQNPTTKRKCAPVFQGEEGIGKGLLMQVMAMIFGDPWFLHPTSLQEVLGQFNSNLDDKLICFLDEMVWGGNKQDAGNLKKLLTEKRRTSNTKYGAMRVTENNTAFPTASNEDWVVPAGKSARRFTVFLVNNWLAAQSAATKKEMAEDYVYSFANFLYNRNLADKDHPFEDTYYKTEGLMNQKKHTMPDIDAWWLEQLDSGLEDFIPLDKPKKKSQIWDAFRAKYPGRYTRDISFWIAFWAILPDPEYDKKNVRVIRFADKLGLEECRNHMDQIYNGAICRRGANSDREELQRANEEVTRVFHKKVWDAICAMPDQDQPGQC